MNRYCESCDIEYAEYRCEECARVLCLACYGTQESCEDCTADALAADEGVPTMTPVGWALCAGFVALLVWMVVSTVREARDAWEEDRDG